MLDRIRGSGVSVVDHHGIGRSYKVQLNSLQDMVGLFLLVQYYGYVNQFLCIVHSQCVKCITSQIK